MSPKKPFLRLILAALLAAPLYPLSAQAEEARITILFTNDTHNHVSPFEETAMKKNVGGIARRARFFRHAKSLNPRTLIVDAGDVFQGTPLYNFFKGEPDIKAMSEAGYDAMAMGNHDLDDGILNLKKQTQYALFPVLCANVTDENDLLLFRPFHIFNLHGVRVAVIGFISADAWQAVAIKQKKGLKFQDPVTVANKLLPHLRQHADLVVGIHHMGLDQDTAFAKQVQGMDVIAGGHSHTKLDQAHLVKNSNANGIGGTLVHQAYRWGIYVGRIDLVVEDGKIKNYQSGLVEIDSRWDDTVQQTISSFESRIGKEMDAVIATASEDMTMKDKYDGPFALGSLIADIIRDTQQADVGIINTGGVRSDLPQGPVSVGRIFEILPFDNTLVNFKLKGQDLKAIVEENARRLGKNKNLQFSGIVYSVKGDKVTDIQVGGQKLDPERLYAVSTADFVFDGGEAISFEKAKEVQHTGIVLRDMMIAELKKRQTVEPPKEPRLIRLK